MEANINTHNHLLHCFPDNIIICNCQKDNTWIWIQDHPKIIKASSVTCLNNEYPKEKCNIPVISQLSIDKHKDNSVSISWFIRNRTAIKALQILYYGEDDNSEVSMCVGTHKVGKFHLA